MSDVIILPSGNSPIVIPVQQINAVDAWQVPPVTVVYDQGPGPQTIVLPGQGCDCE